MFPCLASPTLSPSFTPFLSFSYHLRAVRKHTAFSCAMFFSFSNFPFHFFLVILFPCNIWGEKSFYLKVSLMHRHNGLSKVSIFKYRVYLRFPVLSIWLLLKRERGGKGVNFYHQQQVYFSQLSPLLVPGLVCHSLEALQVCSHNPHLMTAQLICGKTLVWT